MLPTRCHAAALALLCGAQFGCSDPHDCEVSRRRLDADEVSPNGAAPTVLEEDPAIEGEGALVWFDRNSPVSFGAAGTETHVRWRLTPDYETARFARGDQQVDGANAEKCEPRIELSGRLEIRTEDGWLDESALPVEVRIVSHGDVWRFVSVDVPDFQVPITDLSGQLATGTDPQEDVDLTLGIYSSRYVDDVNDVNDTEVAVRIGAVLDEDDLIGDSNFGCAPAGQDGCR